MENADRSGSGGPEEEVSRQNEPLVTGDPVGQAPRVVRAGRADPPSSADGDDRNDGRAEAIRADDVEPYFALQYVARLFKIAAMVVVVALTAEVIAGVALEGVGAVLPLFAEVIRGVVLAAILWGVGDLTVLFIDVGHDVRAARVLLGRLSARNDSGEREERPLD
ncbi:MAG: hypothetical protein LBG44_07985 [Gemmatimonadota bacterium]|jgi:hypothetical protein|nr:hypothetical protein [Gemmatimonadota bacterium]